MKRRTLLGVGTISIGAGALYGTNAFSSISAERGGPINTAEDSSALLGIDRDVTPPTVTNNSPLFMNVELRSDTVEFDVSGDGSFEQPVMVNLPSTTSREIQFRGGGEVTLSADLFRDGPDGSYAGTISIERDFTAPPVRGVDGSAQAGGPNGQFSFQLENTGNTDIEITAMSVDQTNTDATRVSNPGTLSADGVEVATGGFDIGGDFVTFTQNVSIDAEAGPVEFNFNKFRNPDAQGSPNVNMEGATVEITVRYTSSNQEPSTTEIVLEDPN
ncbi:hypothetical protein [Natronorubrum sp. DTA7]|uniref:hypothetical protein n=1 Tax=Natronorubrum sp. DTA7 TaxID=3447016 RepID=UPI003F86CE9E